MTDQLPKFAVTGVGSLPRPAWLLDAIRKQSPFLGEAQDAAVVEAVKLQQDAGLDIVTDGEQRRDNFYSFIAEKISGVELLSLAKLLDYVEEKSAFEDLLNALDVPAFAIKNPVVTGKLQRARSLAVDGFLFTREHTSKPVKITLPGPYLLSRSLWVKGRSNNAYPDRESLNVDVVRMLREELADLACHGATIIQFAEPALSELAFAGKSATRTFMCAALAANANPHEELELAVRLLNEVIAEIPIPHKFVHICRGNWRQDEDVLLAGPYDHLIPYLNRMDVDGVVLEFATPRSGSKGIMKKLKPEKRIGFGIVNPRTIDIENPEDVATAVRRLIQYVDEDRIWLNPDCGFGTFVDRPVATLDIAFKKLRALSEGARLLRG